MFEKRTCAAFTAALLLIWIDPTSAINDDYSHYRPRRDERHRNCIPELAGACRHFFFAIDCESNGNHIAI
jgi:hypothetical protein